MFLLLISYLPFFKREGLTFNQWLMKVNKMSEYYSFKRDLTTLNAWNLDYSAFNFVFNYEGKPFKFNEINETFEVIQPNFENLIS